jgi:DNA-binding transcriptional LysR family regulator
MLSWDDFRYVEAIADTGSLVGAAERLGINHSTVFRRLGQIEQQLGSRLFERRRGGYVPTVWGEEMIALAKRMGDNIVSFEHGVRGQDLRPAGDLRITTSDVLLLHLLSDILIGFRRAFPEIVLDIVVSNQRLNLARHDADVAVRTMYHNPDTLLGSKIARIAWAVFGPDTLAERPFQPAIDAERHDWVAFSDPGALGRAAKWLRKHVGDKRIVYRVDTMIGLAEAAASGMGLVLLPCYVGAATPGLAQLTPPLPELERELWVLSHPDRDAARIRTFIDYCVAEIARRRDVIEGLATRW